MLYNDICLLLTQVVFNTLVGRSSCRPTLYQEGLEN